MVKALIARKVGMTSTISKDGVVEPVTLLLTEPNVVAQIKTTEIDGYNAIQLGSGKLNKTKIGKSKAGHLKKSKHQVRYLREFRVKEHDSELKVGDEITVSDFEVGELINVTSISKGKGWAGTIKRHNFHRGRKTHGGQSYRRPGSIGSMYPQKIFKGKKMAGQMGHTQVTVRNLKVLLVDGENNVLGVKGAVPGPRQSIVEVRGA
jgi:large subunit ribosomal protein L3